MTSVEKAELTVTKRRGAALETALLAIHDEKWRSPCGKGETRQATATERSSPVDEGCRVLDVPIRR